MKKIGSLFSKHKSLVIIGSLALILLVIMLIIFLTLLLGGSKDKYGNRLEGINEVKINKSVYENIEHDLMETGSVSKVTKRLQGRIVIINIIYNKDVGLDKAKGHAEATLGLFSEEELAYYDICYYISRLVNEEIADDKSYYVVGTKHPNIDKISWTRS